MLIGKYPSENRLGRIDVSIEMSVFYYLFLDYFFDMFRAIV